MSNIKKHSKEGAKAMPEVELLRGCTVPVGNTANPCMVIRHPIIAADLGDEVVKRIYTEANKENDGNYDEPILNTILALGRQMHEMQLDKGPKRGVCPTDLSPRTKAVVIPKVSLKFNAMSPCFMLNSSCRSHKNSTFLKTRLYSVISFR